MKMNKKTIAITSLFTVFALGVGLIINASVPHAEVDASNYSVRSVPTTINLNDASESTIRGYYASLNNLSENERKGTNLLKNLKPILKNGQKYLSYGGSATTAVWQAYEIVDRDWNKSPASSISGYNAQTNTITGYVYGKSNSNVGSNPYIHALYVNRNVENQQRAWGNHNQVQWGINQEHLWAKSCGFQDESPAAGARGDLMHLWAGNGRVNGDTHSNYYYGYVDTTKTYNNAGSYASTLSGNLRGYSKTLGGSVTVFEPQDSDKGDIARAIFYMAARYNYLSGSDSDGIDAGNPNLEIVNDVTSWQNNGYQSTTTRTGKMGIIQDLLKWNEIDPPDEFEIHRNNLCYNNFTKNRNPFIDYPSWANAIWGTVDANGNYNSTPATFATPSTDAIGSSTVNPVFSISNTQLNLEVGETATLSATNADGNITWSVDNSAIASLDKTTTVNNGNVTITALSAGSTTITATNGNQSLTCNLTVSEQTMEISLDRSTASIEVGQTITLVATTTPNNAQVTWLSSDEDVAIVSNGVITGLSAGTTVITAKLSDSVKAQCTVTVTSNGGSGEQSSIEIATSISAGDTVYLTANSADMQFNGISSTSTKYGLGVSFEDEPDTDTYALEVATGANNGTYAFKIKEGNNANKYLSWTSGNSLTTGNSIDTNSSWYVDFDNAGNVTIKNSADQTRVIWWNVSDPRFACYTGKSNGSSYYFTQLWKVAAPIEEEYVEDYLDSVESLMAIGGNETSTGSTQNGPKTIDFSTLGLTSGAQYTEPFDGDGFTVTFAGGGNDGKYYDTGTGIRTYGDGTITIHSEETITGITMTWSGTNKPENGNVVDVGTYDASTGVWTGSENTIVFTRPSGSGHWRLQAVTVTFDNSQVPTVTVDHAYMEFGITIPVSDWDAINANEDWEIADYGVMFVKKTTLEDTYHASSVEEAYYNGDYLKDVHKGNGENPYSILDMYIFTAKLSINNESNYDVVYCAASYIVVNDTYYFLKEERESIRSLAAQSIGQGTSELSDDALTILKGNYGG